jgi:hypothetical protein
MTMGAVFTADMIERDQDEAGVHLDSIGRALVTWTAMQDQPVTVADAMKAFNTTEAVVHEAVADAAWISVRGLDRDAGKQLLELDGE